MKTTTNLTIDRIVTGIAVTIHAWEVCMEVEPSIIENIKESAERKGFWRDWASIDLEVAGEFMGIDLDQWTEEDDRAWEDAIQIAAKAWLAARE